METNYSVTTNVEQNEDYSRKLPKLTIDCLITEMINLLDSNFVNNHEKAKHLLNLNLKYILFRNGAEPFTRNEQEFYNLVRNLINRKGKINEWVLDQLSRISLGENSAPSDTRSDTVSTQNMEIQKLRQDLDTLNFKFFNCLPMAPISPVSSNENNSCQIYKVMKDSFVQFSWISPFLLTPEQEQEIQKNLKSQSVKFEQYDQVQAAIKSFRVKKQRQELVNIWREWHDQKYEKIKENQQKLNRILGPQTDTQSASKIYIYAEVEQEYSTKEQVYRACRCF